MEHKTSHFSKYILLVFSVLLLSFTTYSLYDDDDDFELSKNLEIYYTLVRELNIFYVDKPDPGKLITENINTMLKELDPYTVYIPESKIEDYKAKTTGEYGGIGANVTKRKNEVFVTLIFKNSPADEAGLHVGDKILKIAGKNVEELNMEQIGNLMKGSANSELEMSIKRQGTEENINLTLSRKDIKIKNVPYFSLLDDKVGYIKLSGFTPNASKEVEQAFLKLKDEGMETLVFDLRGNPGGLLIEAVKIVNLFVPEGELVVKTIGRVEQWNHSFKTASAPLDTSIAITCLVNSMSASASEIVSGALQDLDRAVIVGERTFGKGLVQATRDLVYNSKLKLTTAKYYIPSGRCIQALDYSHRNPDGSVGKIPDSLMTEFKTKNGRKVFDGGGILPDVTVETEKQASLLKQLQKEYVIFDFLNQYINTKSKTYTEITGLINDKTIIFNEFVAYAEKSGFKHKTKREEQLNKLIEIAKQEKTYKAIESEIKELKGKLDHNLRKDLTNFEEEISKLLLEEMAMRLFYLEGKIKYNLMSDPYISEAQKIIKNNSEINSILSGN